MSSLVVTTTKTPSSSSSSSSSLSCGNNWRWKKVSSLRISKKRGGECVGVRAERGGNGNSGSIFIGGFVLGGIIVGALGCVYAPQISKALTGTDRKDLMRKLPKFIYDEEKALEKTRKVLADKIAQLNSAIDDVSSQLRSEDSADTLDEIEASI